MQLIDPDRIAGPNTTRGQIVAVARRQLADQGLASLTIRQVAREVGVDPGTVRHYFKAKADLAQAAADGADDMTSTSQRLTTQPDFGAGLIEAAAEFIPDGETTRAALAACLTGGEFDRTQFGSFLRQIVEPVAHLQSPAGYQRRAAAAVSTFLGLHMMERLLPGSLQVLTSADARSMLARSIEQYLRP